MHFFFETSFKLNSTHNRWLSHMWNFPLSEKIFRKCQVEKLLEQIWNSYPLLNSRKEYYVTLILRVASKTKRDSNSATYVLLSRRVSFCKNNKMLFHLLWFCLLECHMEVLTTAAESTHVVYLIPFNSNCGTRTSSPSTLWAAAVFLQTVRGWDLTLECVMGMRTWTWFCFFLFKPLS